MANELRRFSNWLGGLVEDNPLASAATTLTSAGLAAMPAVGTTEHMLVIFDPDGLTGAPYAKRVTAHTASATTATIEATAVIGTTRAIDRDTPWVHAQSAEDATPGGLSGGTLCVRKLVDESVTSSTTLQNDDVLLFPIAANEVWVCRFVLFYTASIAGDIAFAVTGPAGSTVKAGLLGMDNAATNNIGNMKINSAAGGASLGGRAGVGATLMVAWVDAVIVNGATAGNVTLQWAQDASDGTATIVQANSFLRANRIS